MFIDIGDGDVKENPELRVCLNAAHADEADRLTWHNIGNEHKSIYLNGSGEPVECDDILAVGISGGLHDVNGALRKVGTTEKPIYFEDGLPVECNDTLAVNISKNAATATQADKAYEADVAEVAIGATQLIDYVTKEPHNIGDTTLPVYFSNGYPVQGERFLPLSAGEQHKINGPLGFTIEKNYGSSFPSTGNEFEGQLFFIEDKEEIKEELYYLPKGGTEGQALIKNSEEDGDASWKEIVALPKGGIQNQILVKNSEEDGDASWKSSSISWVTGTSSGPQPKIFEVTGSAIPAASDSASGVVTTGAQTFAGNKTFASDVVSTGLTKAQFIAKSADYGFMIRNDNDSTWFLLTNSGDRDGDWNDLRPLRIQNSTGVITCGTKLYGAVWNDYAEFRTQKETIEPGYCVASSNNGQVYKTTEKFQACDGIVSDTFGFSIGETDECKTPLAVAGRVLAYFHGNREDYYSGDTVCAGPDGKICKMTREEIKEWPDRIIGIVSEIPEYETWGTGNIPVNGRIWIKIK